MTMLMPSGAIAAPKEAAPAPSSYDDAQLKSHPIFLGAADYSLAPIWDRGLLQAVTVTMRFDGDGDGTTVIELPDAFAGQKKMWRHLSHLSVKGAKIDAGTALKAGKPQQATLTLLHSPSAPVEVSYRVHSAYDAAPTDYANGGAVIRPDWFTSFGEALFASIEGREHLRASFTALDWPANWHFTSDLTHDDMPGGLAGDGSVMMTQDDIAESTLLAGPRVEVVTRPITDGTLHFAMLGDFDFSSSEMADELADVISAQRNFWGDGNGPFTVTLYELGWLKNMASAGGTGRSDGFALEATNSFAVDFFTRLIAHEHNHSWVPQQLGEPADTEEAQDYWISEGVNEFYTARTLLHAELWSAEHFVDDLNDMLVAHASSPVRDAPNSRIVADFWNDPNVDKLPYQRGWQFALLLDGMIRQQSGGARDYDGLIAAMRDRWKAAPSNAKPQLRANFIAVADAMKVDVQPLIERYITRAEPIPLESINFGLCGKIEPTKLHEFDPGFDRTKSSDTGRIAGVTPDGPAWKAGLRNGMKRIAYVTHTEGDARAEMAYTIADENGERTIRWFPASNKIFTAPQFIAGPDIETDQCSAILGGRER